MASVLVRFCQMTVRATERAAWLQLAKMMSSTRELRRAAMAVNRPKRKKGQAFNDQCIESFSLGST